jgi:hypothetical protein
MHWEGALMSYALFLILLFASIASFSLRAVFTASLLYCFKPVVKFGFWFTALVALGLILVVSKYGASNGARRHEPWTAYVSERDADAPSVHLETPGAAK